MYVLHDIAALIRKWRPEEVAKPKYFILGWTKRDSCGKITYIGKLKEDNCFNVCTEF